MPNQPNLQHELSQVHYALKNNRPDQAKRLCVAICEKNPASVEARLTLGQIYMSLGDFDQAADSYNCLLSKHPENPVLHYKLADARKHAGKLDAALKHFQRALDINHGFAEACAGVASIHELKGEHEQALRLLSRFIKSYDPNPLVSLTYGKLCQQVGNPGKAIPGIEQALSSRAIDRTNAGLLHFQAGRLYEALEDYEKAFAHFSEGNRLKNFNFDADAFNREITTISSTFTREVLDGIPHSSCCSENLVFIVGMMRSGTSLTEQILASHPKVHAAGELPYLGEITASFRNLFPNQQYAQQGAAFLSISRIDALARQYLERLGSIPESKTRITDKMPFNFFRLQLIELLFPNARIIQCIRNPLDTCISCYCNDFVGIHSYAYDLVNMGNFYKGYERLMSHWKDTLRTPIMELHYEELVHNPDKTIKKLVEFCGLDWDDSCLRFFETDRFVNTASYDQVRKPLYTKSIGRWRNYEPFIPTLLETLEPPEGSAN